jgi:outer membrane murein-binding lipoprotein Lpp
MKEKNKMEYQEYKPSDPEYLNKLAADYKSEGRDETSKDIFAASDTIKEQKTKIDNLERQTNNLKEQLEAAKSYQEKLNEVFEPLVANLFNSKMDEFIGGKLTYEIDAAIDNSDRLNDAVNDIDDLRSQLDGFEIDGDQIAETVRDMIRDGDISVNLEVN